MALYKGNDAYLHFIKPYLDTLGSDLWYNYFENKVIPNKKTNIPKLVSLPENKWRYTIIHSNHGMLSKEEIIALQLSDLRLKILVQTGFETNSKGEILQNRKCKMMNFFWVEFEKNRTDQAFVHWRKVPQK